MVCIHANQIKICTTFAYPQIEQEFLFLNEGLLSTHFALLFAFLKWEKGVYKAGLSPLSTLAGSLLFPRKSVFQKSGTQSLTQFGTYPVTEELMHAALDDISWREEKAPVSPLPFASFPCPCEPDLLIPLSVHQTLFANKMVSLTQISCDVVHRWTPGVATSLRSILPEFWQWLSFPILLWKSLHRLGICISS